MGGNVTGIIKKTGKETQANKIPIKEIGRSNFVKKFNAVFKLLNKKHAKKFGEPIWPNEKILDSGFVFNGSTSFIMDTTIKDSEITKIKPTAGDIDIAVPEGKKESIFHLLDSLEDTEIMSGVWYMGSNKSTVSAIGEQINCVFVVEFGDISIQAQVDFEFLPFAGAKPTEWAKFSHSSSFKDARAGIKAVHHKYLIRALVGGASTRDDIVIVTAKSTPEKLRLKKMTDLPRMLKFSVGRGIRVAYEPVFDDGKIMQIDGKDVYREVPSATSDYKTMVNDIYELTMGNPAKNPKELEKFHSFVGILELIKKYMSGTDIKRIHERYIELLWGKGAQGLERNNPALDLEVKMAGYEKFTNELNTKDMSKQYLDAYYKTYRISEMREKMISFRSFNSK